MSTIWYLAIIFIAFAGALLSLHIWEKKRSSKPLVCPLGADCDTVIHSPYAKFFNIPLEYFGGAYYGFIALSYAANLALPGVLPEWYSFAILAISFMAFLFSIYLTILQGFVIKEWCTWCLTSASFTTAIFVIAFYASTVDIAGILTQLTPAILVVHILGMAIGLGAATTTDVFFFKFLRDSKISEKESSVLHTLSQIIWFSLGIVVLTGAGLYIPEMETLNHSGPFLLKVSMVAVLLINGVILNLIISPRLVHISFGEKHKHAVGELHHLRKLSFALGAVSIITWYSIFMIALTKQYLPQSFFHLALTYGVLLLTAITVSQFSERRLMNRHK